MKRIYLLVLSIISILPARAQKDATWWYFGNGGGLDFTSGVPVPVSGGQTNTVEGSASVSDANGDLLFYTDGINIWNKNHALMPNGSGLTGNLSSTQSALIVQQPGSANLYYVFTTGTSTYNYSIVDMTLAGGNGDVTSKNVLVHLTSSERSTAVRMPNGNDFWILGHEAANNTFFAYQLTAAGVSAIPVLSSAGVIQGTGGDQIGYLRANPDRTKLAMAIRTQSLFEVFDFDNSTGVISNAVTFPANYAASYGVEFSPDGSRLYLSGGLSIGYIYQVDMTAPTPAALIASSTLIANPAIGGAMGTMQLGPDCKIYAAKYNTTNLGVINDPNTLGTGCNYVDNQVALTSGTSQAGLPNYFEMTSCASLSFTPTCLGDSTYFTLGNTSSLVGAGWDFGDPGSGVNNFASVFNPVHFYSLAGTYVVQLIKYHLNGSTDTNYVQVTVNASPSNFLGNDTTICTGTNLLIDATGFSSYLWNDGSTNATLTVVDSGLYFVTVNDGVCNGTDSIFITTINCSQPIIAVAASDTSFCEKQCIDFIDLSTNNPTSWQWFFPGASPDTSTSQNPTGICYNNYGSFDVKLIACNSNGCDSIIITNFIHEYQNPSDSVYFSNDTLWSLPFPSYQWYEVSGGLIPGATYQYFIASNPGSYYCVVNDSIGCVATSNTLAATAIQTAGPLTPQGGITIVPNPNNGDFTLLINSNSIIGNCKFQLINVLGEILFSENLTIGLKSFIRQFNFSKLESGIYLVKLSSHENELTARLIIKP